MADQTDIFVEALQDFSDAIYSLSQSIQANAAAGAAGSNSGDNSKLFDSMVQSIDILEVLAEDTKQIKSNTEAILKSINAKNKPTNSRKKNKISEITDKMNSKGLVDGIKNVIIMSTGILAMGLAFSVLKNLDFKSILAFSIALPLVAYAFEKIGSLDMKPKDYLYVGIGMVAMSISLLMSGAILQSFPTIPLMSLISMIGVSLAMSIAMYGISKASNVIKLNKIQNIVLLSAVMPSVAYGMVMAADILKDMPEVGISQAYSAVLVGVAMGAVLIPLSFASKLVGNKISGLVLLSLITPTIMGSVVSSAHILNQMPDVTLSQAFSAVLVGVSLGAVMIPLAFAHKLAGNMKVSDWLLFTASMPIIAGGIVISAFILSALGSIQMDSLKVLEYSLSIGASMLIFGGVLALFNKMGLGIKSAALGTLSMVVISTGIMAMSWILSVGKYDNGSYPSLDWTLGVGGFLLLSMVPILAYGLLASSGIGAVVIIAGIASMLGVANGIVAVSHILKKGDYSGGPTESWALGTGNTMVAFATAVSAFKPSAMDMIGSFFGGGKTDNVELLKNIARAIPEVAKILKGGDYTGGPSEAWAKGVGTVIVSFAQAIATFKPGLLDMVSEFFGGGKTDNIQLLKNIAAAIPEVAKVLKGGVYEGGPTESWAKGTGLSIKYFAEAIGSMSDNVDYDDIVNWINPLKRIGRLMPFFANILSGVTFGSSPNAQWSKNIGEFLKSISSVGSVNINEDSIVQIMVLSKVFLTLADSLRIFSKALWSLNGAPSLTGIYEGIALLSIIDASKLNNVLSEVQAQDQKVLSIVNTLSSAGDGSMSSAKIGKDSKINNVKGKPNSKPGGNVNTENSAQVLSTKQVEVNPINKSNEYLKEIQKILKESQKLLKEIGTNTEGQKSSKLV